MTDHTLLVKPVEPGMGLRDPQTKATISDDGARVPNTAFWQRRVKNGDVELLDEDEWAAAQAAGTEDDATDEGDSDPDAPPAADATPKTAPKPRGKRRKGK